MIDGYVSDRWMSLDCSAVILWYAQWERHRCCRKVICKSASEVLNSIDEARLYIFGPQLQFKSTLTARKARQVRRGDPRLAPLHAYLRIIKYIEVRVLLFSDSCQSMRTAVNDVAPRSVHERIPSRFHVCSYYLHISLSFSPNSLYQEKLLSLRWFYEIVPLLFSKRRTRFQLGGRNENSMFDFEFKNGTKPDQKYGIQFCYAKCYYFLYIDLV